MRRCRILLAMLPKACWSLCPKRYDQDPANQDIVDALKADKKESVRAICLDHLRGGAISGDCT